MDRVCVIDQSVPEWLAPTSRECVASVLVHVESSELAQAAVMVRGVMWLQVALLLVAVVVCVLARRRG
jgi:hypothetical protein